MTSSRTIARRGDADPEAGILRQMGGAALAAAADLAQTANFGQAQRVEMVVDSLGGDAAQRQICGCVVADDDHKVNRVSQRQMQARLHLSQHARAVGFLRLGQRQDILPRRPACRNLRMGGSQDRDLDGAGRLDTGVRIPGEGCPGLCILGIKADAA